MARPKKETDDKRDRRMTLYMTGLEEQAVKDVVGAQNRPVTQIVQEAIRSYLDRLAEPPTVFRQTRVDAVMHDDHDSLKGYVCARGHTWWVPWYAAMPVRCCPLCGTERELLHTWNGDIKRRVSRTAK